MVSALPSTVFRPALVALALVAATAACGARGGAAGPRVQLQVDNDLIPPSHVTVHAVPTQPAGSRRLVGSVPPSAARTLSFDPGFASGEFVLVARTTAGREITSTPILLQVPSTVQWSISSNIATIQN